MAGYESARLKIERAYHHIGELNTAVQAVPRDRYAVVIDVDPQTGDHLIYMRPERVDRAVALIIGDAANNLRSSLDHAFASAAGAVSSSPGQIQFPMRDTREGTVAALHKIAKKFAVSPDLQTAILDDIRPYDALHGGVADIHKLANWDKHRAIIPVYGAASVTMGPVHFGQGNVIQSLTVTGNPEGGLNIARIGGNYNLGNKIEFSLDILFGQGSPADLVGKPVIEELRAIAIAVSAAVDKIEAVCP